MKKVFYLVLLIAMVASCKTKEPHYVINGKIAGADSVTFLLQKRAEGKYVKLDSAVVKNGEFTLTGGKVDYPELVYLMPKGLRGGMTFYLENAEITITGHLDSLYKAVVTGSRTQDEVVALDGMIQPISEKYSALSKEYRSADQAGDAAKVAELEKQLDATYDEIEKVRKDFVRNNPGSFYAASLLSSLSYSMEADEMESIINAMDTTVSKTRGVQDLKARVAVMKTVAVGQKAPDFTMNDVNDLPVALSSKVGKSKLLLIDFWAAWCGPCRQENPNVVKVWKEYNKKGFDVYGVSLDRPGEKDKWLQAIKDDNLTWTHVSDLQYWQCAAAKLYAVNAIPANFLLDETGTIIARNLRGEDLENKVKEVLGSL